VNDQAQMLRKSFGAAPAATAAATPKALGRNGAAKSIAVTSGKGGVGKSTISLALGVALAALNKKVCIIDADLGLANIHLLLGIAPKRNMEHLVNDECVLSEVITSGPRGVHIIPGASGIQRMADLEPLRLAMLQRKLAALEDAYDYLIIDTGAGIGGITVEFASKSDLAIVALTPDPASFADAYAMVKVLYEKEVGRVLALLNMVGSDREGKETFDKLNALVVKFLKRPLGLLGVVPVDTQVALLAKRQKMALMENPRGVFAARIATMARALCGAKTEHKEGFFARIFKP
jgi:flagellar biosynthesis protein FlhG